ncbi:transcriptional regulator FeaR [Hafnia alvei]|uniref:Transcriptional regulator FeaR n=1 Tax=Hafnia alvei TaxID=569 RepID=A0ABD7QAC1_HAFAL|nr:transcriptional regulator FeaR [Hafnia alvei]MDN6019310.1 transcriptional regulator FeaR [Enterobacterales bacterium]MBI0277620.1 transcriptional regulator FeaR [Hafnia alvei]MDN6071520.1 transcriptional regulator FeaR [Enterobacterales bacterium]MDN6833740.1 transcriptional regulator FeaR [Enterobacterales bacterium]PNK96550.1 transcriptional regulator FeaR [Hafnia alvei]
MTTSNPLKDADFEGWLASINQACGRFAAKTLGEGFSGSVQEFRTGALRLSMVDIAQTKLYRTPKEIAQSDGSYFYTVFQLSGHSEMEQEGQRALLSAGDITLIDAAKPSTFTFSDTSRQISLLLPRGYLERNLQFADLRCAQRLAAGAPMVRLSQQLVQESMRNSALDQQESEAVLDAVATLLRPALIARDDDAPQDKVFSRTLTFIDKHIQSESLRPEWIASEVGVSVRSLYRMFARKGLVVAQYIKNRRLDLCANALRSAPVRQKLSDIGYSWGFADHSHFSTAFKTRFGITPGEYRKQYR